MVLLTGHTDMMNNITIHSVNYYDNYDFIGLGNVPNDLSSQMSDFTNRYVGSAKGKQTGQANAVFSDGGISRYIYTSFYYDDKGRIVMDVDNKIYSTYGNIQKFSNYLGNLYLRWQPSPKTNLTLNMNCGWTQVKNDDLAMSQSRWNWGGNINFTQDIWWKLKLFLNAGRWEQQLNNVYNYAEPKYWHSISLQRSFLKENRLVAEIGIDNPFEKYQKYKQHTTQGDFTSNLISKDQRRYFMFKLTYRFGSLKSQVKKAAKTITNDDLVGQKKQS